MCPTSLEPGGLYILLYIRHDPPIKDNFHWALYLHEDHLTGGTKYHVREQGSGWIIGHGPITEVLQEFLLVGLFQIATVPKGLEGHVDEKLRTYDASLNTAIPGITCRVWLLWVLALLQKPINGWTVLKCDNLDELEAEAKEWGNLHAASAAGNVQPRPVDKSSENCPLHSEEATDTHQSSIEFL